MSSLLDRYIHAVERHLPKAQRQDIGAELRETIQSRMDESAAERGRDLTDDEVAQILRSVGRPVAVAGRYDSSQYVIGPSLYPYYKATLKALATIALPLVIVGAVVGSIAAENPILGALGAVGRSFNIAWSLFGVVTLIFWQMGRVTPHPNFDQEWDPRELPRLPQTPRAVPRAQSISHAVFLAVYLAWWIGLLPLPDLLRLMPWTAANMPQLAPVWQEVALAITAVMAVELLVHVVNIWQPEVPRWRLAIQVAGDLAALGIIYVLLQADTLVFMAADGPWASRQDTINDATKLGLIVLAFLIVVGLIFDEGRRLRGGGRLRRPDPRNLARAASVAALHGARFSASRTDNGGGTRHP